MLAAPHKNDLLRLATGLTKEEVMPELFDAPARICAVGGSPTRRSIEGFTEEFCLSVGIRRYPFTATLCQRSASLSGPSDRVCLLMICVNELLRASAIISSGTAGVAPTALKLLPARDCLSATCGGSMNRPVAIIGLPRQSPIC